MELCQLGKRNKALDLMLKVKMTLRMDKKVKMSLKINKMKTLKMVKTHQKKKMTLSQTT